MDLSAERALAGQPLLCWSLTSSLTGREEKTARMSRKRTQAVVHLLNSQSHVSKSLALLSDLAILFHRLCLGQHASKPN